MILDFSLLIWLLCLSVPVYWALPEAARPGALALVSGLVLALLSPLILIGVALHAGMVALFAWLDRGGRVARGPLKTASWAAFVPMALSEFVPPDLVAAGLLGQAAASQPLLAGFTFLGLSYTAIRAFLMIREILAGKPPGPGQALAAFLFFGSFVAGPIAGAAPYARIAPRLAPDRAVMALSRIGWGSAMLLVLKPALTGLDLAALTGAEGRLLAWLELYRDFLALYVDFSGYTDIAIGCALLYGVTLPENFNWPLRATSIQEFWQRWHLSLGAFIGTYLFKPFVRHVGRPTRAIFLAFTVVGLWHVVSWPYFLWGIGHGAALALNMVLRRRFPMTDAPRPARIAVSLAGWALTMSYVALLSGFANEPSLRAALALLERLFT